jgi:hypothetical protein
MKGASLRSASENRVLAMVHPLRAAAFKILTQHEATASEILRELDLPRSELANVNYHVKHLVELGCAEVVGTRRTPGKRAATLYRASERAMILAAEWDRLTEDNPGLAGHLLIEGMQVQVDDFKLALRAKTVGEDEHFHLSRTRRVFDFQGLCEALELREETRKREDEIERRAAERRAENGCDAIHVSSSHGLFRVPPPEQR